MTERREGEVEVFFGVKLSDVTDQVLQSVVDIYFNVAEIKPVDWKQVTKEGLTEQLLHSNGAEYRFGSKYSMNSKLWVRVADYLYDDEGFGSDRVVRFAFEPNMDIRSDTQKLELQVKEEQFRKASSDFLMQAGLGIPLEQR